MSREVRSPFDLTANLHAYVPRKAIEGCLLSMVRALRGGVCRIALTGPTGHGKTLVLQMIADRVGHELGFVYLPYGALPPADLCAWALGRMEVPKGEDAIETLVTLAGDLKENGKALLLLIDDANTLSQETASWLSTTSRELDGGLRVVVAGTDGPLVAPVLEALGDDLEHFRLDEPMTLDETREYIVSRLENAQCPASTRALFDDATIRAIHRSSEGVARQIHQHASAALRGIPFDRVDCVPEAVASKFAPEPAPVSKPKPRKKARRKKRKAAASPSGNEDTGTPSSPVPPNKGRSEPKEPLEELTAADPPPRAPDPEPRRSVIYARRSDDGEPLLLEDVIFSPRRDTLKRPPIVTMAAPTRMRVFRSSLIIAAALVGVVLARPAAEFTPAELAAEREAARQLARGIPTPARPRPLEAPRHPGMDVTSVQRPLAHPTLGNLRDTLVAADAESTRPQTEAPAPRGRLTPSRGGTVRDWFARPDGRDHPETPPAAPGL